MNANDLDELLSWGQDVTFTAAPAKAADPLDDLLEWGKGVTFTEPPPVSAGMQQAYDTGLLRQPPSAAEWDAANAAVAGPDQTMPRNFQEALVMEAAGQSPRSQLSFAEYYDDRLPFAGGVSKAVRGKAVYDAAKRMSAGEYPDETSRRQDHELVAHFLIQGEKDADKGWWEKVWDTASAIPGFGIEFAGTAGAYTAAKALATKGAGEATVAAATKVAGSSIGKAAEWALPRAVGVAAQTAANPQLIASNVTKRLTDQIKVGTDEEGMLQAVMQQDPEPFLQTLAMGFGDSMVEIGSEKGGEILTTGLGKVLSLIPGSASVAEKATALKAVVIRKWLGKPGRTVKAFDEYLKKAGWHGVVGETLEERAADVGRGITGIEGSPLDASSYGTTGKLVTDPKQGLYDLSIEAAAFLTPGAQSQIVRLADLPEKRRAGRIQKDAMSGWKQGLSATESVIVANLDEAGRKSYFDAQNRVAEMSNAATWIDRNIDSAVKLSAELGEKEQISRNDLKRFGVEIRNGADRKAFVAAVVDALGRHEEQQVGEAGTTEKPSDQTSPPLTTVDQTSPPLTTVEQITKAADDLIASWKESFDNDDTYRSWSNTRDGSDMPEFQKALLFPLQQLIASNEKTPLYAASDKDIEELLYDNKMFKNRDRRKEALALIRELFPKPTETAPATETPAPSSLPGGSQETPTSETPAAETPPATVRLYHGGIAPDGSTRWVTPDRNYAQGYAEKTPGGVVSYIDLPSDHPLLRKAYDDTGTSTPAPFVPFDLPSDLAGQLKLVEPPATEEPAPAAEPPAPANELTFEEFKKQYTDAFKSMNQYSPDEIGSSPFAAVMAGLADRYPDWAEAVENEITPPTPAPAAETPAPRHGFGPLKSDDMTEEEIAAEILRRALAEDDDAETPATEPQAETPRRLGQPAAPTWKAGDRVTFTDKQGQTMTGVVAKDHVAGEDVSVEYDFKHQNKWRKGLSDVQPAQLTAAPPTSKPEWGRISDFHETYMDKSHAEIKADVGEMWNNLSSEEKQLTARRLREYGVGSVRASMDDADVADAIASHMDEVSQMPAKLRQAVDIIEANRDSLGVSDDAGSNDSTLQQVLDQIDELGIKLTPLQRAHWTAYPDEARTEAEEVIRKQFGDLTPPGWQPRQDIAPPKTLGQPAAEQPDLTVTGQTRPVPGMDGVSFSIHSRQPDIIPDTFRSVFTAQQAGGGGYLATDGTGMTAQEAYERAKSAFEEKVKARQTPAEAAPPKVAPLQRLKKKPAPAPAAEKYPELPQRELSRFEKAKIKEFDTRIKDATRSIDFQYDLGGGEGLKRAEAELLKVQTERRDFIANLAPAETPPSPGRLIVKDIRSGQETVIPEGPPAAPAAEKLTLPDRWTADDVQYVIDQIKGGSKILIYGGDAIGMTTPQEAFGSDVKHHGYGMFSKETPEYKVNWDAGTAAETTPSGNMRYARVREEKGSFPYDAEGTIAQLEKYLPAKAEAPVETPPKRLGQPAEAPPPVSNEAKAAAKSLTSSRSAKLPEARPLETAADQAEKQASEDIAKLVAAARRKLTGKDPTAFAGVPLDPELMGLAAKAAASCVKAKITRFAAFIDRVAAEAGEDMTRMLAPYLEKVWKVSRATFADEGLDAPGSVVAHLDTKPVDQKIAQYTAANALAAEVTAALQAGEEVTSARLFEMADRLYGGTRGQGTYRQQDAYNALETGINRYILDNPELFDAAESDRATVKATFDRLRGITASVASQTVRDGDKDALQQFSTPPHYAYLVNWLANIVPADTVLEPSAGNGGIAVFAANAAPDNVFVNEYDDGRAANLETMGFAQVTREDAEKANIILPGKGVPKVSVVVMNPPFSRSVRMDDKQQGMDLRHIDAALAMLQPNGRLVAIIGAGLHGKNKSLTTWENQLAARGYTLRADVEMGREIYKGYGTTFPTRVLVLDKRVPLPMDQTVSGEAENVDQFLDLLENIREDRNHATSTASGKPETSQSGRTGASRPGTGVRPGSSTRNPAGPVGTGPRGSGGGTSGSGAGGGRVSADNERPGTDTNPAGSDAVPGPTQPGGRAAGGVGGSTGPGNNTGGKSGKRSSGDSPELTKRAPAVVPESGDVELSDAIYDKAETPPLPLPIEALRPHPAHLVESAAMASTPYPTITFRPNLGRETTHPADPEKGISEDQLVPVCLAGMAQEQFIQIGEQRYRKGIIVGDGTGVGKGRIAAALLLHSIKSGHGNGRAVFVTKASPQLLAQFKQDFADVGGDPSLFFQLSPKNHKTGMPIDRDKGILFISYDTLKGDGTAKLVTKAKAEGREPTPEEEANARRIDQISTWLGGVESDAAIIMDEAHLMGNCIARAPSQRASAGIELQNLLPMARVTYMSATAATEVRNLGYADRLGLWGVGTEFDTKLDFVNNITAGKVAAMEKVAADMKALGLLTSRQLSLSDVVTNRIEHPLTPAQMKNYELIANTWIDVQMRIAEEAERTNQARDKDTMGRVSGALWGASQRFWDRVLTTYKLPTLFAEIEKCKIAGQAVLIQLTKTQASDLKRALEELEEDDSLDQIDLSPKRILVDFVRDNYPVIEYVQEQDPNDPTKITWVPLRDSDGNVQTNPDAVAARDALLEEIDYLDMGGDRSAIDQILDRFGRQNFVEMTGRINRTVPTTDIDGFDKTDIEKRGDEDRARELKEFNDDKRWGLIFSQMGGTGASYHASNTIKNKRQRVHFVLQPGWRADVCIQGLGRSHRTNQAVPPIWNLITTDVPAEARFISTIAGRLGKLGAITKGNRETTKSGMFKESDDYDSDEAGLAVSDTWRTIAKNEMPDLSADYIEAAMSVKLRAQHRDQDGTIVKGRPLAEMPDMTRFLNRTLGLPVETQQKLFAHLGERIEHYTAVAREAGTLDSGVETVRADHIAADAGRTVYTHEETGAETKYIQAQVSRKTKPTTWQQVQVKNPTLYFRAHTNRAYTTLAVRRLGVFVQNEQGETNEKVRVYDAMGYTNNTIDKLNNTDFYTPLDEDQAERAWGRDVASVPEFHETAYHMLSGVLLPIWKRIGTETRVVRMKTDDGRVILGRLVPATDIARILRSLNSEERAAEIDQPAAVQLLADMQGNATLTNGWQIKRARFGGENRIELIGPSKPNHAALQGWGVFWVKASGKPRYFIPTGDRAVEIITTITTLYPISDFVNAVGSSANVRRPPARLGRKPAAEPGAPMGSIDQALADAGWPTAQTYGMGAGGGQMPVAPQRGQTAAVKVGDRVSFPWGNHVLTGTVAKVAKTYIQIDSESEPGKVHEIKPQYVQPVKDAASQLEEAIAAAQKRIDEATGEEKRTLHSVWTPEIQYAREGDSYARGRIISTFGAQGTATERALQAADWPTAQTHGMGAGGGTAAVQPPKKLERRGVPDELTMSEDVEARLYAARYPEQDSLTDQISQTVESLVGNLRARRFIPSTFADKKVLGIDLKKWAVADEVFRLIGNMRSTAQDQASRIVGAIVTPLTAEEYDVFERILLLKNLNNALESGQPLRFGLKDAEEVSAALDAIPEVLERYPAVEKAIETRNAVVKEIVQDLVDHKLLPEKVLEHTDDYFHQMVRAYQSTERFASVSSVLEKQKKSFQKRRIVGPAELSADYDYDPNYVHAELSWMADAQASLALEKHLATLRDNYDSLPKFKQGARQLNYLALVGGEENAARIEALKEMMRDGDMDADTAAAVKDELFNLDPTYPYRIRIATALAKIGRLHPELDLEQPTEAGEAGFGSHDFGDEQAELWSEIRRISLDETDPASGPALGLFKAINDQKKMYETRLGDKYLTWERLAAHDQTVGVWTPEPGNIFFPAFTVPAKVMEQFQQGLIASYNLTEAETKMVFALGGPRGQMVLPVEIIQQLKTYNKGKPSDQVTGAVGQMMHAWKEYQLHAPWRIIGYNIRNVTGDLDAVISGAPGALKYVSQAMQEIGLYYHGAKLSMSPDLKAARDYGVISSGLVASEIEDAHDFKVFEHLFADLEGKGQSRLQKAANPKTALSGYRKWANMTSNHREAVLRYAAFLHFKKELESGNLKNFAASDRDVVKTILKNMGADAAAAHLSRDLLGDYGDLSQYGQTLRRSLIPFWSFQEINLKRFPSMIGNSIAEGDWKGAARSLGVKTISVPLRVALAVSRNAWMFAGVWLFNHIMFPDDEENQPEHIKSNPHITLGRTSDGQTITFNNVGALGDFLEWGGINTLASQNLRLYQEGKLSASDLGYGMGKDVLNKLAGGLGPWKSVGEVVSGLSFFPDATNPRPTDREDLALQGVGLKDEYQLLKDATVGGGDAVKPNSHLRYLGLTVNNAKDSALQAIHAARERFLRDEGVSRPSVMGPSKYKQLREAAKNNDYAKFKAAKAELLKTGDYKSAYEGFRDFLRALDPVEQRLNPVREKKFVEKYLNPDDRVKLDIARAWARDQELRCWLWWEQSSLENDSPERRKEAKKAVLKERASMMEVMDKGPPNQREGEPREVFAARLGEAKDKRKRTVEDLKLKRLGKVQE